MLGLIVHTEVNSSYGRCDMQIITPSYIYIFEFKIDTPAKEALDQIVDKSYARPFLSDGRTVFLIGAGFSTLTCTMEDWGVEKV